MALIGCFGPTGHCQRTAPCQLACALRIQPAHGFDPAHGFHQGAQPLRQLTEADVRRIVREELARATKGDTPIAPGGKE